MERTQNLDPGKYWRKPVRSWAGDDTQLSSRKEPDFPEIDPWIAEEIFGHLYVQFSKFSFREHMYNTHISISLDIPILIVIAQIYKKCRNAPKFGYFFFPMMKSFNPCL